ncbi:unnamed protein product, partial [Ectocarpus sp. 12 AP-2014]
DGSGWGNSQKPVYIVEVGAGSAKLSYVLLQKLLKLSEYLPRPRGNAASDDAASADGDNNTATQGRGFCFKYVITDFSHANFGFWMNHPRLQELFTLGVVDFAVFDAEARPGEVGGGKGTTKECAESEPPPPPEEGSDPAAPGSCGGGGGAGLWGSGCLRLELCGEELRPGDLDNPVIVVANYVFDSLKQDAFRVHGGVLEELLCTTSIPSSGDVDPASLAPELLRYMR